MKRRTSERTSIRALRLLALGLAGSIVSAGCVAILGDYGVNADSNPGGGGGSDGGSDEVTTSATTGSSMDGSHPDGGDAGAGGGDTTIPLVTLTCNTWRNATPVPLENLEGVADAGQGVALFYGLTAFSAGPNTLRLVGARDGTSLLVSVLSIDTSATPPVVTSIDIPNPGTGIASFLGTMRLSDGFGVLVALGSSAGTDVYLYPFHDSAPISPLPATVTLVHQQGETFFGSAAAIEIAPSSYFIALVNSALGIPITSLQVGVASGTQTATMTSVAQVYAGMGVALTPLTAAAHAGADVFLYIPQSDHLPGYFQVPDTGNPNLGDAGMLSLGEVSAINPNTLGFATVEDTTPGDQSGTTNVAFDETDQTADGGFASYTLRASAVPNGQFKVLAGSDVTFGLTITDQGAAPKVSLPRLFGDDLVTLGSGDDGFGNPTSWVNFLWLDAHGVVRAKQTGASGGLGGPSAPPSTLVKQIVAAPGPRNAAGAAWNLVWSKTEFDNDGDLYDALYYNELDCK